MTKLQKIRKWVGGMCKKCLCCSKTEEEKPETDRKSHLSDQIGHVAMNSQVKKLRMEEQNEDDVQFEIDIDQENIESQ